ncbi:hypothetical protein [Paenibacillus sp. NPDC058071]|uniref:hypothetical protein n=1 Tax=Paenibacillus sp. NPDC058071 TaxID=3346326 RepID=UPI0036D9F4C4
MLMRMRKITCLAVLFAVLSGCSIIPNDLIHNVKQQLQSSAEERNPYVLTVKNGNPVALPDQLFGDTFERFFANPAWTYFRSESAKHVVEFTGNMMYKDTEVTARLQFIVDDGMDYFEVGALSFNEVPQTELVKMAMLEKVFEKDWTAYLDDLPVETYKNEANSNEEVELDEYDISGDLGEKTDASDASGSFADLYSGTIPGIPSAIGDNFRSVRTSNVGLNKVREVALGFQLEYPQYTYNMDYSDWDNPEQHSATVGSITLERGQPVLDIKIGDTPNQIIERWGAPYDSYKSDPDVGEGEPYTLIYTFGDYSLVIYTDDDADSPSTYAYYQDNIFEQDEY